MARIAIVRLIDRHGDRYYGVHGDRLPQPISWGTTVRVALNDAAIWLEERYGDGHPFRAQYDNPHRKRFFFPKTEEQRRKLRDAKARGRNRLARQRALDLRGVMTGPEAR